MNTLTVWDVYSQVKEISRYNFTNSTPIHVERITSTLGIEPDAATNYLSILQALGLVEFIGPTMDLVVPVD